jgi:hypothetical protein
LFVIPKRSARNLLLFLFVIPSEAEGPAFLPPFSP